MSSGPSWLSLGLAAAAAGTIYILIHERRRKAKKQTKASRDQPISKELLLQILHDSAEASKALEEEKKDEEEKAMDELLK